MAMAANDGHSCARGSAALSVEYLHYQAVQRDEESGINDGVAVEALRAALIEDGHPVDEECPYSPDPRNPDWQPDLPTGELWRRRTEELAPTWGNVYLTLSAQAPVIIVLSITDAFYDVGDGILSDTAGNSRAQHAVLGVALHTSDNRVLVRNSWGAEWGVDGYAWISAEYIQARCVRLIRFGESPQ